MSKTTKRSDSCPTRKSKQRQEIQTRPNPCCFLPYGLKSLILQFEVLPERMYLLRFSFTCKYIQGLGSGHPPFLFMQAARFWQVPG
uniref:Uncharacterized protein n=1 Tax=Arundo donax TaxID=35708 RepID=A0A0A9HK93_ARUDO